MFVSSGIPIFIVDIYTVASFFRVINTVQKELICVLLVILKTTNLKNISLPVLMTVCNRMQVRKRATGLMNLKDVLRSVAEEIWSAVFSRGLKTGFRGRLSYR